MLNIGLIFLPTMLIGFTYLLNLKYKDYAKMKRIYCYAPIKYVQGHKKTPTRSDLKYQLRKKQASVILYLSLVIICAILIITLLVMR